jgi:type VI secretion system protein ImpH
VAATGRTPNPDLTPAKLPDVLVDEPYCVSFFQAVRMLQRLGQGARVGGYANPSAEAVRFRAHASLSFPASEIQTLTFPAGAPPEMTVNFMGLTGPLGVLPHHLTELVRDRLRYRDTTLRDFLDIFNHRLISFFYLAWEKYRPAVTLEHGGEDAFRERLFSFLGLGTAGLRDRSEIPDESLLFSGGLLMMHSRSATTIEEVLREYFGVPVEIEQFVGAWRRIEDDALCNLGYEEPSQCLGVGAVVGDEIWDAQAGCLIKLGPLNLEEYRAFMPGGSAYGQLRAWVSYFAGLEFSVEVELILRREDVPACELSASEQDGPQLGWTSWVKSAPFQRDPADLVLELN